MKIWTSTAVTVLAAVAVLIFAGCVPTSGFTVGGTVSGLSGQVVLSLNSSETLTVSKNGVYKFATRFEAGTGYSVSIASQSTGVSCVINNGDGVVSSANVSNANLVCQESLLRPQITSIWPKVILGGYPVKISGNNLSNVSVVLNGESFES